MAESGDLNYKVVNHEKDCCDNCLVLVSRDNGTGAS
jgi:hypothetical protein